MCRRFDAARRVFGTRGYHHTSIADVIEAAHISRGTFYLYFDSKDALFRELLEGFVTRLMDMVEVVRPEEGDAAARLYDNLHRVVELLFANRYLTILLLREAIGVDDEVDKTLNRLHVFWREMVVGALVNGARWGIIRDCNAPIVATAIIGSFKEVLYQHLVVEQVEIDPEAVARALFDYGLRGLLPR